jgi:hypothetical protein
VGVAAGAAGRSRGESARERYRVDRVKAIPSTARTHACTYWATPGREAGAPSAVPGFADAKGLVSFWTRRLNVCSPKLRGTNGEGGGHGTSVRIDGNMTWSNVGDRKAHFFKGARSPPGQPSARKVDTQPLHPVRVYNPRKARCGGLSAYSVACSCTHAGTVGAAPATGGFTTLPRLPPNRLLSSRAARYAGVAFSNMS